jgi:hypothetical protein
MAERSRFWRTNRWRDALRPDSDLALAEGLAAGTGLLTGTVARSAGAAKLEGAATCATCGATAEIVVVDLVDAATTFRCPACRRRWTAQS